MLPFDCFGVATGRWGIFELSALAQNVSFVALVCDGEVRNLGTKLKGVEIKSVIINLGILNGDIHSVVILSYTVIRAGTSWKMGIM